MGAKLPPTDKRICKGCGRRGVPFYEYNGTCKECILARNREWVKKNRPKYLSYQRQYSKENRPDTRKERIAMLDDLKARPCEDCGNTFPPECMDFDHKRPHKKHKGVSCMVVSGSSWEKVLAEVAKCRLICANCHRVRTAKQHRRGKPGQSIFNHR